MDPAAGGVRRAGGVEAQGVATDQDRRAPRLSVCVPTYNRPELLRRAIASIIAAAPADPERVEIVVSDNSPGVSEGAAREALGAWDGRCRYLANATNVGITANLNQCIASASGDFVLFVGDDDQLLPGAIDEVLAVLDSDAAADQVLLFGVDALDDTGRVIRRQRFPGDVRLPPRVALRQLLAGGFAWFPGVVVRRDAVASTGTFEHRFGSLTDLELWARLFARYGVRCLPPTIAVYSVHRASVTQSMDYDQAAIESVLVIFDRARETGLLAARDIDRCESTFLDQFILGGAYVRLQAGDSAGARRVLGLYALPGVRAIGPSRRWQPVRMAFRALSRLPGVVVRPMMSVVTRFDLVRRVRGAGR